MTAWVITRPMTPIEMSDCTLIAVFTHGTIGIVSAGLNARTALMLMVSRARHLPSLEVRELGDLVVDVVLWVAVPAGALQPGRHDQPGGLEPAGLVLTDPGAVVAGTPRRTACALGPGKRSRPDSASDASTDGRWTARFSSNSPT